LSPKCERHVTPGHKEGHNAFIKEWILLAGSQWAESIQDDAVVPTFGKTLLMLQNCHNKLKARKVALLVANPAAV
jgi:hypothetical protein